MATSGVPYNPDKQQIIQCLINEHGRITNAADALDVQYVTLKRYIDKHPDLVQLLDEIRQARVYKLTHAAEDTLDTAIQNKDADMTNALKASFYVLNNLGRRLGYAHEAVKEVESAVSQTQLLKVLNDPNNPTA